MGADYTIKVQKEADSEEWVEVGLRKIDEPTWLAASKLINAGRELDAVRMIINTLAVEGNPKDITDKFDYVRGAMSAILEFIQPLASELKKN